MLDPNASLVPATTYSVTLTGGASAIRDLTGLALTAAGWSFTTA